METLCFGCMQSKECSPICEHCGYDESKNNLSHQLPVGTLLKNQYLVGRVLGQGGFGITYLGWDQNLSAPVAIKEYFPNGVVQRHTQMGSQIYLANGEAPDLFHKHRERFLKEARTLAQLTDIPEIVQIRNFFSENDTAYIVMEYVQGITLKEHLKKLGRPMTETEALAIMEPMLRALQKVHDHGLIHRDISPDNIMLPVGGGIKLIDFGTVRYADDSGNSKSTEAILKPGFAPMEQYNTRGNLGTWTDVYAVCATFHYLLTGQVPPEVMTRFEGNEALPQLQTAPDISRNLVDALEKGMKIRVPERIQTIRELYQLLYEKKQEKPDYLSETDKKSSSRHTKWIAAAIAGLLLTACSLLLLPKEQAVKPAAQTPTETVAPIETIPQPTQADQQISSTRHEIEIRYNEAVALAEQGLSSQAAIAFGKLGNYRDAREQSFALWSEVAVRETIIAQMFHNVGLRTDGTVLAAGLNNYGQCNVSEWTDIIAISAGTHHTVGLRADGTVVAVGNNIAGACDVSEWTDIIAIKADGYNESTGFTVGIQSDGTIVSTGYNGYNNCNLDTWTDIVYVTTSSMNWNRNFSCRTIGLRTDGTVLVAGDNEGNWCDEISQWTDIVSISSGGQHIVGLKSDGTTVYAASDIDIWGLFPKRYSTTEWDNISKVYTSTAFSMGLRSDGTVVVEGNNSLYDMTGVSQWKDITELALSSHAVGLKSDGTVVSVGFDNHGNQNISQWSDIAAVRVNYDHTLGVRSDGTAIAIGNNQYGQCDLSDWTDLVIPDR